MPPVLRIIARLALAMVMVIFLRPLASGGPGPVYSGWTLVKNIRFHTHPEYTRIVIDLDRKAWYRIESSEDASAVTVELRNVYLRPGLKRRIAVGDGRVNAIGLARPDISTTRVVIEMESPRVYRYFALERPYRIVVDIKGRLEKAPAAEKTEEPPVERPHEREAVAPRVEPAEPPEEGPPIMEEEGAMRIGGYLQNETAYRTSAPDDLSKVRNIFFLEGSGRLGMNVSYKVSARAVYDAVFDLTSNFNEEVEDDQEFEVDLRDTYVDISLGDWDVRLGRQQIVWGEAVGLFFADVVNAKDLREFVLPDFDYIRIPHWGADVELTKGDVYIEFVWIPVLEFNKTGVAGSEFPPAVPVPDGVTYTIRGTNEPGDNFRNSEAGGRISYFFEGWDLSVFYLYTWDKFPAYFRTIDSSTRYTFNPEHKRLNVGGFTLAKEISDIILKTEFVYSEGKYFAVIDDKDSDGVVRKASIDYLVGMDYTLWDRLDINVQFMQRIIPGYKDTIFREERIRSTASIRLKTGFRDNTIEPEILIISSLEETDMMIRPKIEFTWGGRWRFRLGADIFEGKNDGVFGQYDTKDRVYTELRLIF